MITNNQVTSFIIARTLFRSDTLKTNSDILQLLEHAFVSTTDVSELNIVHSLILVWAQMLLPIS